MRIRTLTGIAFLLATEVWATPCGSFAGVTNCVVNFGSYLVAAGSFRFASTNSSNGEIAYQPGDVLIDISDGGDGSVKMTFSKNPTGPSAGTTFVSNHNGFSSFTVNYQIAVIPSVPGTGVFNSMTAEMVHTQTGSVFANVVQNIVPPVNLLLHPSPPIATANLTNVGSQTFVGHIMSLGPANPATGTISLSQFSLKLGITFTPSPAVNVSGQVLVTQTGFVKNRSTGRYVATMMVTNLSGSTIPGPIHVVFYNVAPGTALVNSSGVIGITPYKTVTSDGLAPGAAASTTIEFIDPLNQFITYSPVTYSGTI